MVSKETKKSSTDNETGKVDEKEVTDPFKSTRSKRVTWRSSCACKDKSLAPSGDTEGEKVAGQSERARAREFLSKKVKRRRNRCELLTWRPDWEDESMSSEK